MNASSPTPPSSNLSVTVASGDALSIRELSVHEAMSALFTISLTVVSENHDVDFEAVVGKEASFTLHGRVGGASRARTWRGLCSQMHQIRTVEQTGLSTYRLKIVPTLWLLTQRRNHRVFQLKSEPDIVVDLLAEWGIEPVRKLTGVYKKRKYRVQYDETDHAFMCRMLEDAGISYYFEEAGGETKLVLSDAPQSNELREPKIAFHDEPTVADREHVTSVRIGRQVRPGKYTVQDHDYRRPASYKLTATGSAAGGGVEDKLERYHYAPGAFLFESDALESTPHADDKGSYRADEAEASTLAKKRLDATRGEATVCTFETNVVDLSPGSVMSMLGHPRTDLGDGKRLLVVASQIDGVRDRSLSHHVEVRSADRPYHPPVVTPKPKVNGVESATVVGPAGEEIHTDEFGRVRVQFHWDREGKMDDDSSCWIHSSQPWGGAGYGGVNLPRVGQEVLVDFLGGDPDRPVIVGRVYTNLQKTPYKLPANKTQSGWKSSSTNKTGGYNEIMFEDQAGKELLRVQAEKDLHKLVKNDESSTVGHDRTRLVKNNEDVTIGKNRSKQVAENERQTIGQNLNHVIGVNRATQVGAIDSTVVGQMHSVMVSPPGEDGPDDATAWTMRHDYAELRTPGGASIVLDGGTITLKADFIYLRGAKDVNSYSEATAAFKSKGKLELQAEDADVAIDGGPFVKINMKT